MNHVEGKFKGFGGIDLYYQRWLPTHHIRAIMVIVHGLGGHSGLFNNAVQDLVIDGYGVYAFDLRGNGLSPGQRGHVNHWKEFREDLHAFVEYVHAQHQRCPCFLWGHSLGGTIALDYALHYPSGLHGLILSAPALGKVNISPVKLTVGRLMSHIFPRFSLSLGIHKEACSRDPKICVIFSEDPLRHEYGSARLATEFFATVARVQARASDLQVPLLMLHGSADEVTLPEASRNFFQQVAFTDKTYQEYSGNYHDLYVDLDYQVIFSDLRKWLRDHLEEGTSCPVLTACTA